MAGLILFANNATSTVASALGSGGTTLTLAAGTGALFPSPIGGSYFVATLLSATDGVTNEIVWCTGRSGDVLTILRGQENTSARTWASGDGFSMFLTAGCLGAFLQNANGYIPQFQLANFGRGTGTWTVPANTYRLKLRVWGGGGGGGPGNGGAGGGGAGGGYCEGYIPVAPGQTITFTVGAGGTSGNAGGNTTISGTGIYANGGGKGHNGVTGGSSGGSDLPGSASFPGFGGNYSQTGGEGHVGDAYTNSGRSGAGGGAYGGPGASEKVFGDGFNAGNSGTLPGAGGSGGCSTAPGGQGADGLLLIEY